MHEHGRRYYILLLYFAQLEYCYCSLLPINHFIYLVMGGCARWGDFGKYLGPPVP